MNYRKAKFDIEKALGNYEVVTRHGKNVEKLYHNPNAKPECRLAAWIEDDFYTWNEEGRFLPERESVFDLFILESNEGIGYVNVHQDCVGKWVDERIYDSHSRAVEIGKESTTYKETIQIECTQ